ncbi:MAG: hypothetical protein IT269_00320 [Saprospiraceae bacterium]|nr:hypothetical protein [Saprospiraceae bacterium]
MLILDLFTPNDDTRPVFLTGSFNGWATKDDKYKMLKVKDGHYQYTFQDTPVTQGPFEYKYIKGGWEAEELDAHGNPRQNRYISSPKGQVKDTVPNWKTHANWYDSSFYPHIEVVAKRFNVPQLRRRRRVSVLLPYNYYQEPERRFPVLYLQDGQNLFENDAPFGTWGVDRQLAALAQNGGGQFIVVGIDHGGRERIKEYMPYNDAKWGAGLGREYARFIAETLKPYIDGKLRTLTDRQNTGIGGSSMGGLISIYAGLMFPKVFSRFMIFSPSLWVSPYIYFEPVHFQGNEVTKIYLYAGGKEGASMTANSKRFIQTLGHRGYDTSKLQLRLEVDPNGRHNEARWGQEFPKAAQWLFD